MSRRFAAGVLQEGEARPMEDPTKTVMDELARTSGVVGVDRLAGLFVKREPDAAKTMSMTQIKKLANEVLRVKPDKQILQYPAERSGGAVHASQPNAVWQIDLADMRTFNMTKTGAVHTHMLVCVDVFTLFTRTAALKGAKAEEVVKAFRAFDRLPETVDSDSGPEFVSKNPGSSHEFEAYLRENHIAHRIKSPHDVNSIATVDRKIGQIKKAISGAMMEEEMTKVNLDWVELMPDIVKGLNEAPTEALRGKAPEDIKSEDAIFDVLKQNAEKQEKAEDKFHKQVDSVENLQRCARSCGIRRRRRGQGDRSVACSCRPSPGCRRR